MFLRLQQIRLLLKFALCFGVLSACFLNATTAQAENETRQYLLGDWNGTRSSLAENGLSVEAILTGDTISQLKGDRGNSTISSSMSI